MPSVTISFTDASAVAYAPLTRTAFGVNGTLVVNYSIYTAVKFKQAIITFTFFNPSNSINYLVTHIFIISLLGFKKNSLIAETFGHNIECPEFTHKLYQVNFQEAHICKPAVFTST